MQSSERYCLMRILLEIFIINTRISQTIKIKSPRYMIQHFRIASHRGTLSIYFSLRFLVVFVSLYFPYLFTLVRWFLYDSRAKCRCINKRSKSNDNTSHQTRKRSAHFTADTAGKMLFLSFSLSLSFARKTTKSIAQWNP